MVVNVLLRENMLFKNISLVASATLLFSINAIAEDLSYLPDPIVAAATVDKCPQTISKNTNKITSYCNKNITLYSNIDQYGIKLADRLEQIDLTWASKKDQINTSYRNKRDVLLIRIADATARRGEILASCLGGIFGGGGDCTQRAAIVAMQIVKLGDQVENNDDRWDVALQKNDTKRAQNINKANSKYDDQVSKANSKINANNNSIGTLNNAIVACNAPAVTCPNA